MEFTLTFHLEELQDGTWRATFDDNYVTWGYGDTGYEAIQMLLEGENWEEEIEAKTS